MYSKKTQIPLAYYYSSLNWELLKGQMLRPSEVAGRGDNAQNQPPGPGRVAGGQAAGASHREAVLPRA